MRSYAQTKLLGFLMENSNMYVEFLFFMNQIINIVIYLLKNNNLIIFFRNCKRYDLQRCFFT